MRCWGPRQYQILSAELELGDGGLGGGGGGDSGCCQHGVAEAVQMVGWRALNLGADSAAPHPCVLVANATMPSVIQHRPQ